MGLLVNLLSVYLLQDEPHEHGHRVDVEKSLDASGTAKREVGPNRPAPVLHDKRNVLEIKGQQQGVEMRLVALSLLPSVVNRATDSAPRRDRISVDRDRFRRAEECDHPGDFAGVHEMPD